MTDDDPRDSVGAFTAVIRAVANGLARLSDLAPHEIVGLSEESDWGLVGGDFSEAIASVAGGRPTFNRVIVPLRRQKVRL